MYAIIKTGGKQYQVSAGDRLMVEKLEGNIGDNIELDEVLRPTELVALPGGKGVFASMSISENLEMGAFLLRGDKKLQEVIDTVNEALETPWLQSSSEVAEGMGRLLEYGLLAKE